MVLPSALLLFFPPPSMCCRAVKKSPLLPSTKQQQEANALLLFLLLLLLSFPLGCSIQASNAAQNGGRLTRRQSGFGCLLGMLPPLGGTIQYSTVGNAALGGAPYPEGTSATLFCQQGLPTGQSIAVCLNGMWQPAAFSGCTITTGSAIGGASCLLGMAPVPNGNLVYSNAFGTNQQTGPYPSGTSVRLQCLNGQLPSGQSVSTCLNGQWQPPLLGSCIVGGGISTFATGQQQQCAVGISNIPLNGRILYSNNASFGPFPANTVATLLCNAGFMVSGTSSSICQNGVFTPSVLGSCVPPFT